MTTANTSAPSASPLPKAPARAVPEGIPADTLAAKIDQFLAAKGFRAEGSRGETREAETAADSQPRAGRSVETETVAEFVCEDDVRTAIKAGRSVVIGERTIVTPSARDLGEAHKVFVQAGWPR